MHKEYTNINNNDFVHKQNPGEEDNAQSQRTKFCGESTGGHLEDRLAQFDVRTATMKKEWYETFSEVRRGSFLSKKHTSEDIQWNKKRKERLKKRGRKKIDVTWESLPASHVQFLHWIGFDYRSGLPLPNEETTQELGFLGYDFMGKIVEKAIFLKWLVGDNNKTVKGVNNRKPILQLNADNQLTKDDIKRALNDSTVITSPLYRATNSISDALKSSQLYFGPGFEERIEMEMDQICMSQKDKIFPQNDDDFEIKENELFEKLKEPPKVLDNILDLIDEEEREPKYQKIFPRNQSNGSKSSMN